MDPMAAVSWFKFLRSSALALAIFCCACGNSPTAPSPNPTPAPSPAPAPQPVNIDGAWQGTWTFTPIGGGNRRLTAMALRLTQSGSAVTGQFQIEGSSGTITGTIDQSQFAGTFTIRGTSVSDTPCEGQGTIAGSVTNLRLSWTNPTITSSTCTWFSANEWLLTR